MTVEKMLNRLSSDGDVSLHYGHNPELVVKQWTLGTLIAGKYGVCRGFNLKETVAAAYDQRYGVADAA